MVKGFLLGNFDVFLKLWWRLQGVAVQDAQGNLPDLQSSSFNPAIAKANGESGLASRGFNASQAQDPELPPPIPPKLLDVIDFVSHFPHTYNLRWGT